MIGLAVYELQAPLYTRLQTDITLQALVSDVFDHVPEGTAYPYVVVGEYTEIPNDTLGKQGREVTVTVHTWSDENGSKVLRQIGDRIVELLDGYAMTVGAFGLMRTRMEFTQTLREVDDVTNEELRHLVQRFRFILYEK